MDTIKNTVIIGGPCRAGKSRLANLIFQQTRCTVVHLDSFSNAVRNCYPVSPQTPAEKEAFQQYHETVLVKVIRNMGKEFDYLRVYESSSILPQLVAQRLWWIQPMTIFLGYPKIDPERKRIEIRKAAFNDPYCWSHGMKDVELLEKIREYITWSQIIQNSCTQYGFPFFDVSINWQDTIQLALSFILNSLSREDCDRQC
ncbi:MAG: hypothetical protein SWJ54_18050 [Cyanobacteriota bacterium]|nr:hypothetical protein [Cyanobacteriota bacterium]